MASGLKFWIYEVEGLYYPSSENKGALISFAVTAKLICVYVFAYAKMRFSHEEAQMLGPEEKTAAQFQYRRPD